jgi:hypothetical protein
MINKNDWELPILGLVGVAIMGLLMFVFYKVSTTCVFPLVDGKCQKLQIEQNLEGIRE